MLSKPKIFSFAEIFQVAREKSPYYQLLYKNLPAVPPSHMKLEDLPIVEQTSFWKANVLDDNRLLTSSTLDGVVFKSGGTTGSPKFSIFSKDEWQTFTEIFGRGLVAGGLSPHEKIANYFYGGALYASFLFIYQSIEHASVPTLQFPIAGTTDPIEALKIMDDFAVGTMAGVPTGIMTLAHTYAANKDKFKSLRIKKILFGGESMHQGQRRTLGEIFPGVEILSIGYASVDAGLLGYADPTCSPDVHRVFSDATVLEIIDEETGAVITEVGKPGLVLITSLTRKVMPIIRYPAGDRAEWVDDPLQINNPRFKLLGRGEEAARVGPVSLYFNDIDLLLTPFKNELSISAFQLEVFHRNEMDGLIIRIAVAHPEKISFHDRENILQELFTQRPMLDQWAKSGKIHSCKVETVGYDSLSINPRTGKMRRIIDGRYS